VRDLFRCSKTKYWYVRTVARNLYLQQVSRNSITKRVSKMNPSVARTADPTAATAVAAELPGRCSPLSALSVEPKPKSPSNQWKEDLFTA
jgi:hypothetical protein